MSQNYFEETATRSATGRWRFWPGRPHRRGERASEPRAVAKQGVVL